MLLPPRPPSDARRLRTLQRYDVLDTPPESALDDLTRLAAQVCETPIALISLIDQDRQWFKSRVGVTATETPRDVAFCAHAILDPDLTIVPDAARDERFADNPLVTGDPHVRFYAGAPLISPEGDALGTLCVMDRVRRNLSDAQREALRVLSRQVMTQLELRRSATELADSERRLFQVFANCPVGISISRVRDRMFVDVNAAFTELLGWSRDEIVGRTGDDIRMLDGAVAGPFWSSLRSGGHVRDYELDIRTHAGDVRRVLVGAQIVELRGEPHAVSTFVDITARTQSEIARSRIAAIVDSSDDAIIGKDLNGIITSWNGGAQRIFGYPAAEMVGTSIRRLIPADRQDEENLILAKLRRGESVQHFETLRRRKDGRLIDASVTVSPINDASGAIIGVSKVLRDITAQKQAVAAIEASEARYRTLFDYAPCGIVISDRDGCCLDANRSACRMLGRSRDELVGLHATDIVAGAEAGEIKPFLANVGHDVEQHREWRLHRKDQTAFAAEVTAAAIPDGSLIAMLNDVTERNRSSARLRRLVDSQLQGVMFWKHDGTIASANDLFLTMIGYTRDDLAAEPVNWRDLTPPEFADVTDRANRQVAANGFCTPFETEYIRKDGTRVPVLLGAASFEDDPSEGVAFAVDLTAPKRLEQQFLRAQRLESIGTLAGGIAHDLNNVLSPILMSVDMLLETIADPADASLLEMVRASALRGAALVQQVLSFARGVESRRITVNLIHIIRDLLKVIYDTFPKSIDTRFARPTGLSTVTGDPSQMHQLLMNLCVNARDAMPDGGILTISMEDITLDETYASMSPDARPGAYVLVQVADSGTGIAAEVRDRIFEPFFTTKEIGKGTGLGLSTCLAIAKSHGGFINVYSERGVGTTFKIYLPANPAESEAEATDVEADRDFDGHGAVVLVVDDEEPIRNITRFTLERFGYRVMLASNGAEAVATYAQHPGEIAVVLTDMAMPVMDGPSMIVALKAIDPAVKVIASSGLAANASLTKATDAGVVDFIPKPYTADTMLATLERVLGGKEKR